MRRGRHAYDTAVFAFLVVLAFAFYIVMFARPVHGHEWLPDSCCHGRDCWPIEDNEVEWGDGVFIIKATGQTIPFNAPEVKWGENPTSKFYRCTQNAIPSLYTHCLFPPMLGV